MLGEHQGAVRGRGPRRVPPGGRQVRNRSPGRRRASRDAVLFDQRDGFHRFSVVLSRGGGAAAARRRFPLFVVIHVKASEEILMVLPRP